MGTLGFRGFVYVAVGEAYVAEAARSAASLKRYHREPVLLITATPCGLPIFDQVLVIRDLPGSAEAKLAMRDSPFEKSIFLDSDTLVTGSLEELFQLLDAFDVCVPAAPGGYHYSLPEVPHAFREPSTTTIAFRKTAAVSNFFARWRSRFAEYRSVMGREWDQRSFRHAAYETHELRICFLGDEWSLSPYPGGMLCRSARVVHGRPPEGLESLARRANERLGYRVLWQAMPVLRECSRARAGELFQLAIYFLGRAGVSAARTVLRTPRPRNPNQSLEPAAGSASPPESGNRA